MSTQIIYYELIKPELRNTHRQCSVCKNHVDSDDCAVEMAVLYGDTIFPTELKYGTLCNQHEGDDDNVAGRAS